MKRVKNINIFGYTYTPRDIVIFSITTVAFLYVFYINFEKIYYLKYHGKCTVGMTTKKYVGTNGYLSIGYKFKIGDKIYNRRRGKIGKVVVPNGKYIVVYYEYSSGLVESTIVYKKPIEGYKLGDDLTDIISKDEIEFSIWR